MTNHVLSMGIDVLWRRRVAAIVKEAKPEVALDLATGSGDLAEAIVKACPDCEVVAADFCQPMLEEARRRGVGSLIVADGMRLPFADETFDVVTIGFGLRNMESWEGGIAEMKRVLRPGGMLVVLDFSLPRNALMRTSYRWYLHGVLPRVAGIMTGNGEAYRHLCGSIERFPSGEAMCALMRAGGFAEVEAEALSGGIATIYRAVRAVRAADGPRSMVDSEKGS